MTLRSVLFSSAFGYKSFFMLTYKRRNKLSFKVHANKRTALKLLKHLQIARQ